MMRIHRHFHSSSRGSRAAGRLGALLWIAFVFSALRVQAGSLDAVKTVFLIVFENHNWDTIKDKTKCPYINLTVLPQAAHAERYYTPTNNHPSEPNYLWLVAGTNFGIHNDSPPSVNGRDTTNHLAFQLDQAGVSWRTYQEDISGLDCPLVNTGQYAVRHNPFMFFRNITNRFAYCTNHVRPFGELFDDLAGGTVARFNFLVPNLTNDMHSATPGSPSTRTQGDNWLKRILPPILDSAAYRDHGAVFITWDEGNESSDPALSDDGPIGLMLLSPLGKGGGYQNEIFYTHSSTLRTLQTIFGVRPFLADAANATDLADLFSDPQLTGRFEPGTGVFVLQAENLVAKRRHIVETSADLSKWTDVVTNTPLGTAFSASVPPTAGPRYFRVRER
jgi:phospholipase C